MPETISQEQTVYRLNRHRDVRCRLWFHVTPFRDGLYRYFLVATEELE